jgi:hypothetical protein
MKYIFSGDLENIGLELIDDAEETERRVAWLWSKAEFNQLTGILIPDYVELLSIEHDRSLFAVKYEDDITATIFQDPQDMPQFMRDLWRKRDVIRKHLKAEVMQARDDSFNNYHYDENLDQIIQTDAPNKDHMSALRELSISRLGTRIITDLIDILIQKGVIVEADLPSYFDLTTVKDLVSKVKW